MDDGISFVEIKNWKPNMSPVYRFHFYVTVLSVVCSHKMFFSKFEKFQEI